MRRYLVMLVLSLPLVAQRTNYTLSQYFSDLGSSDPVVVAKAKAHLPMPTPGDKMFDDADLPLLCRSTLSPVSDVQRTAVAYLAGDAVMRPQESGRLLTCLPGLLKAAADAQTRTNVLVVLASVPSGPPIEAHAIFLAALKETYAMDVGIATLGLLREGGGAAEENQAAVIAALDSTPDVSRRGAILHSIAGSQLRSQELFVAVRPLLTSSDEFLQQEAIQSVASSAPDNAAAISAIEDAMASGKLTPDMREMARGTLISLRRP